MEELLLNEEFTEVDAKDKAGQTALHTSTSTRNRDACELLLKSSTFTKVDARDKEGRTALHLVAHWGDLRICNLILQHERFKADSIHRHDHFGHAALFYATTCGHLEVAKAIAEAAPMPTQIEEESKGELMSWSTDAYLACAASSSSTLSPESPSLSPVTPC